jgi:flagellar biogenesis protein FliO
MFSFTQIDLKTSIDPRAQSLADFARRWWMRIVHYGRRTPRRLRLCESLPLGERRFIAVVEFEQARFLLGGTSASLVLLARLEGPGVQPETESNPPGSTGPGLTKPGKTEPEKTEPALKQTRVTQLPLNKWPLNTERRG